MQRFGAARWLAIAGVGVLVAGVAALTWAALQHANPPAAAGEAEPVPTFELGVQTPSPTPTPTPTAERLALEERRMLAIGSEVWWRATAGSCTGPAPVVERSNDRGSTWIDVTPEYLGIRQVQTLEAFSGRDAEMVAGMADCEPEALRTFTRGEFWESYPDVLAASRYVEPRDAGSVHLPSGPVPAPCPAAFGLHAFGDTVALVCAERAWSWAGEEWVALAPEGVVALTVDRSDVVVAHRSADCAGVALSRVAPDASVASLGCAEGSDAAAPVAIDVSGDSVMVWSAGSVRPVAE